MTRDGSAEPGLPEVEIRAAGRPQAHAGRVLGESVAAWRRRTAEELGLPPGPVIAAGHQAEWWHPGIVAKFLWAQALAERDGAALAWLLVDTDVRDAAEIRFPSHRTGRVRPAVHRFAPRAAAGTVPALVAAFRPSDGSQHAEGAALPCVEDGIARAHEALTSSLGAPDAAMQVAIALPRAIRDLRTPHAVARTSTLLATSLGTALLDRMASDPGACAEAFNAAARHVPRSARPLAEHGPLGPELPIWTATAGGVRRVVRAGELGRLRDSGAALWPRAFLTGMLARMALADRVVHGTGAASYERATERFAAEWLCVGLPPIDVVTATLRLPFPPVTGPEPVDPASVRRRWFDPAGSNPAPSAVKAAALAEIDALPRRSRARRERWLRMHAELAASRTAHACDLAALQATVAADRERTREATARADRAWPAVLHPPESISQLASEVRSRAR